jgi:hypothetical protein
MAPWYEDFASGFKKGWNGTLGVMSHVPVAGSAFKAIPKLHKGGRVPKTGNYRLKQGEVVLNKTQLARLKKAKTQKTRDKIINSVKKKKPKKMKHAYN